MDNSSLQVSSSYSPSGKNIYIFWHPNASIYLMRKKYKYDKGYDLIERKK